MTRRNFMQLAVALPAGASFSRLHAFADPQRGQLKITDVKAMAINNIAGNCLIRVDTDAGITGYGEAGQAGRWRGQAGDNEAAADRQGSAGDRGAL